MASTKADNNRVGWVYTDDYDLDFCVSAKDVYVNDPTDGAKYGGSAQTGVEPAKPRQLRMRRVRCTASGHKDKWVVAYEVTATIWTTPGTTLTLDSNGVDVAFTAAREKRAERYGNATRDAA